MAGRGPRPGRSGVPDAGRTRPREAATRSVDLAGRPRGTGFVADHHGTVITSHEAVDGLARLVLHAAADRTCVASTADAVTALPDLGLALVRTEGLGLRDPLPVTVRDRVETGTYVRIAAGGWREARVLGTAAVTYTATDRFHLLDDALELAIGTAGSDALRLGGGAAGGPVLDAGDRRGAGASSAPPCCRSAGRRRRPDSRVPLRARCATGSRTGRLAATAARATRRPCPGTAPTSTSPGVLELTATSVGSDGPPGACRARPGPVGRVRTVELREFAAFTRRGPAAVLGLVGSAGQRPYDGTRRPRRPPRAGAAPPPPCGCAAPTCAPTTGLADAARRALDRAGRIVAASSLPGPSPDRPASPSPAGRRPGRRTAARRGRAPRPRRRSPAA